MSDYGHAEFLAAFPKLNSYDSLAPVEWRGGRIDDRQWLIEQRDVFIEDNPDVVATLHDLAVTMIALQEGTVTGTGNEIRLPKVEPARDSMAFPGSAPDVPLAGLQLTLDQSVKELSGNRYFVHWVDSMSYEIPKFMNKDERPDYYSTFGLVERTDLRHKSEFDPPFVLAISSDFKLAQILPRASDEIVAQRQEAREVDRLVKVGRSDAARLEQQHYDRLWAEVRDGVLDPYLPRITELVLSAALGTEGLENITASENERWDMGRSVQLSTEQLYLARAILELAATE